MNYPSISVVIPLFNKQKDIGNTLQSVLNQTYQHFEIIVVNDGSTDKSGKVVERFLDERIQYFEIDNCGAAGARNYGIQKAVGEYIAFLDADDYWYPDHLENVVSLIRQFPEGRWFATAYEIYHSHKMTLPMDAPIIQFRESWRGEVDNFFKNSLRDCMAWTSAVCMKKSFINELGGFNTNFDTGQDVDLWIRAALQSNLYFSNKISARYRFIGSNRLTHMPTLEKKHMEPDAFVMYEGNNPSLKKYLDLIRYSFAIKFKVAGSQEDFNKYKAGIQLSNITSIQRILLKQPKFILKWLLTLKSILETSGLRIRTSNKD
jgi:glycosyltransferase involved in cell wall biosynthesis